MYKAFELNQEQLFMLKVPTKSLSPSGANVYRVLNCRDRYIKCYNRKKGDKVFTMRLQLVYGQTKVVKITGENNAEQIAAVKSAMKNGKTVWIALQDLSLYTFGFAFSRGFSLYSHGFHIIKESNNM